MTDKDKRREGYIEATMDYILAWTFKMCDKTMIAAEWMYHPYHFEMYQS